MTQPDLAAAVSDVLAPALAASGFGVSDAGDTVVTLVGGRSALRLSYKREDLPRAWLSVAVGVSDVRGNSPAFVALWRIFPDDAELQDRDLMGFDSQGELCERLARVRDDWLPRFIAPALVSEPRLQAALVEQERELQLEYAALKRDQHLRDARSRLDGEDYQGAVDAYVLAGVDTLSAADSRRLAIARRHL